jgi:streptogramin lyase
LNHNGTLDNRDDDTWITFTENDGLHTSHSWVEDFAIDSHGRLWFWHSLGATRLDHNGTPFNKDDGTWVDFSNGDGVRSEDVDPNNSVWFGTRGKGVARLNGFDNWTLFSSDGQS